MLWCNLTMHHLAVCKKSYSKLKKSSWQHWLINNMPVHFPIMLALCSMLLVTYYDSNYAGIIGLGLVVTVLMLDPTLDGIFVTKISINLMVWGSPPLDTAITFFKCIVAVKLQISNIFTISACSLDIFVNFCIPYANFSVLPKQFKHWSLTLILLISMHICKNKKLVPHYTFSQVRFMCFSKAYEVCRTWRFMCEWTCSSNV